MTSTSAPQTTFTARTPEDVLAVVPVVLGFHPQDSVVMLTFGSESAGSGGRGGFHARVDLPQDPADLPHLLDSLLGPTLRQRVPSVLFVVYTTDPRLARRVVKALLDGFLGAGVDVIDTLRADGRRWYAVPDRPGIPGAGVPYDLADHPFRAQAVFDGVVTLGSRAELVASLAQQPDRAAAVASAVGFARPCRPGDVAPLLRRHLDAGSVPDVELAGLLLGLRDLTVRDAAWLPLTREGAQDHVRLWSDAVRRAPDDLVAGAAAVLGMACWVAGHGALAWCAVDRCRAAEPDNSLARLVADLLQAAVPPSSWGRLRPPDP